MRRALAIAALAAGACGGDGVVDLTIALDPSVSDSTVAQVRTLTLEVTGLETTTVSDPLAQPFAHQRQERLVVRSPAGGAVMLAITARGAGGQPLLYGQIGFTLAPGSEIMREVTLSTVIPAPDGGPDLAPPDLAAADHATGTDLAGGDRALGDLAQILCPAGVALCDGFESGNINPAIWNSASILIAGTVAADNTRAHRGQWSLRVHTSAVAANATTVAEIGETSTFATPGQGFYVRAFYYFPAAAAGAVATMLDASQISGAGNGVSLSIDHDALSTYDSLAGGLYTTSTTPKVPLDAWTCVEWHVDTGNPNAMHAWVNGTPVPALDVTQLTTGTPQLGRLDIGLAIYPPNPATVALDVWIDDVIVDHSPIGCAR